MDAGMLKYLQDLGAKLDAAPRGQKTPIVQAYADKMGMSVMQVYRKLSAVGWHSGRKARKDAGTTAVPEDVAQQVAGLVVMGARKTGKRVTTVKAGMERLSANGITSKEGVMHSAQALSRAMRLYGVHPDQLKVGKTAVRVRSKHPNHVWELDASLCVLFYLGNGRMGVMDEKLYNKNKPHNVQRISSQRVWRYVVVDHCSGAFYVHYCMGAEGAENALDALIAAMQKRGDADAFYGIPKVLYTDAGSGHKNSMVFRFCARLNIEHLIHMPGNARATGSVEVAQNLVERGFESRMAFASFVSLEEIQAAADLWRVHVCARQKHSRTRKTRFAVWTSIAAEHLRIPASPEALRELGYGETQTRVVTDFLTISYSSKATGGSHEYDVALIPGIFAGAKVEVRVNLWRAPAVDVTFTGLGAEGAEPACQTIEPIEKNEYGFTATAPVLGESYASKPKTKSERKLEEMELKAYGAATAEDVATAKKRGVKPYQELDHFADVKGPQAAYFPRMGEVVVSDVAAPVNLFSHMKAAKILRERCGQMWDSDPKARMAWLRQRHPEGVPQGELDALAKAINSGEARILEAYTGNQVAFKGA